MKWRQKLCSKKETVIGRGKKMKHTTSEVMPVENINKNPRSSLEISPVQMEVPPSRKRQDHACE